MKKILIAVVIILFVVILGAALTIGFFLDNIVKKTIEAVAPQITKTSVTLDAVHVSPFTGGASIKGFKIGNPEGYPTTNAITIGKASVSLAPSSLMSQKIIIHSVEVREPEIIFDGNPFGANNLTKLRDNINGSSTAQADTNAVVATGKPAKKLEVDDFLLSGVKVYVSLNNLGNLPGVNAIEGKQITLTIPDIHLTGLGQNDDGITSAELTKTVLNQITKESIKAVTDYAKTFVTGDVNNLLKGGVGTSTNTVNKLTKSLKGLFGK
jgi:uncharacterized protein involved in outer membrane biogenesis